MCPHRGLSLGTLSLSPDQWDTGNKQGALVPSGLLVFLDPRIIFASSEVKKIINGNDLLKSRMLMHSGKFTGSLFKPIFRSFTI